MKNRKFYLIILCLILTAAIISGCAENITSVNDTSEESEISVGGSTVLENSALSEDIPDESTDESKTVSVEDNSAEEDIEISGINWALETDGSGRWRHADLVEYILDNEDWRVEPAWATVILESLTPLGKVEIEGYYRYYSIAEIKIIDFHYYGKDLKDVAKSGDTIKIIVPYIVNEDGKINPYVNNDPSEPLITYAFPMTEVGERYVVSLYEYSSAKDLKHEVDTFDPNLYKAYNAYEVLCAAAQIAEMREDLIKENYPELADLKLRILTSYPMFSMDISKTKILGECKLEPGWLQMYVATYDRYMKGKVSEDSAETKFYDIFKESVYNYFGPTPEKPTEDKTEE